MIMLDTVSRICKQTSNSTPNLGYPHTPQEAKLGTSSNLNVMRGQGNCSRLKRGDRDTTTKCSERNLAGFWS